MARKQKGKFIEKLLMGAEKSETYARDSLPSNRWELFWDIFKGRFGKLVIINLLTTLFLIPLYALFIIRSIMMTGLGGTYPFNQPFGTGYLAPESMIGYNESIVFSANLYSFLFLPLVMVIAAVGIAGCAYVIRNMVWTEGLFVSNDFWHGIKTNFKSIALTLAIYSLILYLGIVADSLMSQILVYNLLPTWLVYVVKILLYAVLIFFGIMVMHMITMTVTYDLSFGKLFKNAFYLTIGAFPANIVFIALGGLFFLLLFMGDFMLGIGIILLLLFGVSYAMLVWTDYCHWLYDRFINPRIKGAKVNRGIYEKIKDNKSKAIEQYKVQLSSIKSTLNSRPIKPITDEELTLAELPESFSRKDIEKLNESRKALYEDNENYIKAHENDPEFEEYRLAQEKKKEEERERVRRIEQAKKELAKHNKRKK